MFRRIKRKILKKISKNVMNFVVSSNTEEIYKTLVAANIIDYDRAQIAQGRQDYYHKNPVNHRVLQLSDVENDVKSAKSIAELYLKKLSDNGLDLMGKKLLEVGPGTHLGTCAILAHFGAEVSAIDKYPVRWQEPYHSAFYDALLKEYNNSAVINSIKESKFKNLTFFSDLSEIADASYDVVVSNSVLEHIEYFESFAQEMGRVTKRGGAQFHGVDFADHRNYGGPLEYLLYDEETFDKIFKIRLGECGHQRRPKEVIEFFEKNGFLSSEVDCTNFAEDDYMSYLVARLRMTNSKYKNWSKEDLKAVTVRLLFLKK